MSTLWCTDNDKQMRKATIYYTSGMGGSGKTTLAYESVTRHMELFGTSLDYIKLMAIRRYGFANYAEYKLIKQHANAEYKLSVINDVQRGRDIIMDYAHLRDEWDPFFKYLRDTYDCELVKIDFNTVPFDVCWDRVVKRQEERIADNIDIPLCCTRYVSPDDYTIRDLTAYKESAYKRYKADAYDNKVFDHVIDHTQFKNYIDQKYEER